MTLYEELKARGLIAQATDEEAIKDLLDNKKTTFYIGFDPTADSLHVGHFLQLVIMRKFQKAGHRPIALLGGGTTMVGDPTGKTDMRKMLTREEIQHNADCFKEQMSRFVDFGDSGALMVDNADWLMQLKYIEFLRDIGVYFSVNKMLAAECFKTRLERGLNFIEFNYMLMQSYDFLKLYDDFGCKLELGGNDQWANIIGGVELVRRARADDVYGMTFTLLTTKEGKKMGKTENGAVWLNPEKTSPYDFFQYWRNIDDADVINCMKLLTEIPLEKIAEYEKMAEADINGVKQVLAFELTSMVHGEAEAEKALNAAKTLFSGGADNQHVPTAALSGDEFTDGSISILDILTKTGLCPSRGEARRLIEQGGITVDDEKITAFDYGFSQERIADGILVRKGKKVFLKVTM